MAGRVEGKITVIAGAGTGVGRACMALFAREGATVVGSARTRENLDESLRLATEAGGDGFVQAEDLSQPEGAEALIKAVMDQYGRIDILVNSVGVGYSWIEKSPGSMEDIVNTTPEKWHEVMAINLDACFYMSRGVVPSMQAQGGGAIVNVGSISGFQGLPVAHTYTAAKGAMLNLTRSLCVTYAKDNIRTNCIAPGVIDTPMVASILNMFDDDDLADRLTPMKRPGTAEEMAYGCLYLGSDEASYCNGTILTIDGGTTARQ